MKSPYNRPTKYLSVGVPKDHHVGPKALPAGLAGRLVGLAGPLVGPKARPVDQAGHREGPAAHLVVPGALPAKTEAALAANPHAGNSNRL